MLFREQHVSVVVMMESGQYPFCVCNESWCTLELCLWQVEGFSKEPYIMEISIYV